MYYKHDFFFFNLEVSLGPAEFLTAEWRIHFPTQLLKSSSDKVFNTLILGRNTIKNYLEVEVLTFSLGVQTHLFSFWWLFHAPMKATPIIFHLFRSNTHTRCTVAVSSISVPSSVWQAAGLAQRCSKYTDRALVHPRMWQLRLAEPESLGSLLEGNGMGQAPEGTFKPLTIKYSQDLTKTCFWIVASISLLVLMLPPHTAV